MFVEPKPPEFVLPKRLPPVEPLPKAGFEAVEPNKPPAVLLVFVVFVPPKPPKPLELFVVAVPLPKRPPPLVVAPNAGLF